MTGEQDDTKAYLARIRRTIAESERLVESVRLRMAETDRMLERQGLTREQVVSFRFSDAQREAVNDELRRRGMDPLELDDLEGASSFPGPVGAASVPDPADAGESGELEARRKKFGMMMKPFQL